jgi:signal transduction histidine kinase
VNIATPSTLLLAGVADSPALYDAFVTGQMDVPTALMRYLIAVIVCGIMLAGLRSLTNGYKEERLRAEEAVRAAAAAEAAAEAAEAEERARADRDDDELASQSAGAGGYDGRNRRNR